MDLIELNMFLELYLKRIIRVNKVWGICYLMKITPGYIVGFADGEGTFNLIKYSEKRIRPQFLLFNTNREILEAIKEFLGISAPIFEVSRVNDFIKRTKVCYRLQVRSREDLKKVVLFFDENLPLVKSNDYEIFKKVWDRWVKDKI